MQDKFPYYYKPPPLLEYQKVMSQQIDALKKDNPGMKMSHIIKAVSNSWETRDEFKNKQYKFSKKYDLQPRTDEEILANYILVKQHADEKAEIKTLKLELKKIQKIILKQDSELEFLRELIENKIMTNDVPTDKTIDK